jgi:hypothetical protein
MRRSGNTWKVLAAGAVVLPVLVLQAPAAHAAGVCPAVGSDTDCGLIITVDKQGAHLNSTGQGPYDDIEDTLVGVVNNDTIPIRSLALSSGAPVFGFDGDGIDSFGVAGNGQDGTGYGGPNAFFSNISADQTGGTVNFITPIPPGGTGFFSLEESVANAVSCRDLIQNSVKPVANGPNITATFTPNLGYTLAQAAQLCGFRTFNWVQHITHQDDPSEFYARNLGGAFDPSVTGRVRLTSHRVPYSDPPQGGGYTYTAQPDFSFPFYYDTTTELPNQQADGVHMTFMDAPGDGCMRGGAAAGTPTCDNTSEPRGAAGGYVTHLAGVDNSGGAVDLGIGFTWTSNYNGTTGGVNIKKTLVPADGNGTGGVTITGVTEDTTYDYDGIVVTGLNGGPVAAPASMLTYTGPQTAANGQPVTLSAQLSAIDATPAPGESVTLTLGSGGTAQSCTATTDATGTASCPVTVAQNLGPTPVTASFAGDNAFQGATASSSVVVFAYTTAGAFVIGDKNYSNVTGNPVTFWSAQWSQANQLSGGPAPDAFKGFEDGVNPPACDQTWTTTPGNSAGLPATVPAYTAVVVSSTVTKSGRTISGDGFDVVVVRTDPGYGPDPGHAGTGTVVATIC